MAALPTGGGRIAVYYASLSGLDLTKVRASGSSGGAGTVFTKRTGALGQASAPSANMRENPIPAPTTVGATRDATLTYVAPDAALTSGALRTRWAYDGNGNVSDEKDAKGQLKHHEYGILGRLKQVVYSKHVAPRALPSIDSVAWTYTKNGEVKTVTEVKQAASGPASEVTTHEYDALERRESTLRYNQHLVQYAYDIKGNRTRVEDGAGEATVYTYDAADRLKTATTSAGVATYWYWPDGLKRTTEFLDTGSATPMTESREYDWAGRLVLLESKKSSGVVAQFEYGYDEHGNRERLVETRGGGAPETTIYGYDNADRLVGVKYPEEATLYSLDAVGNRKGEKRALPALVSALTVAAYAALAPGNALAVTERDYNAVDWMVAKHQVLPAGPTTSIVYDANGNRVTEGVRQYEWDVRDTLTRVTQGGVPVGTYDYDAALQRVKAETAEGQVAYELDGMYVLRETGARTRRYHYGEGEGLGVTDSAGARWLLDDGQGSVSVEVGAGASASGAMTHRKYDAWGNYRSGTAPVAGDVRLGYTGHQYDVESGLTYARARYYDSVNGVFLSRDSMEGNLAIAPSLHRFAYAHSNPLLYADRSGHFVPLLAALAVIVAFAVAVPNHEPDEGASALSTMALCLGAPTACAGLGGYAIGDGQARMNEAEARMEAQQYSDQAGGVELEQARDERDQGIAMAVAAVLSGPGRTPRSAPKPASEPGVELAEGGAVREVVAHESPPSESVPVERPRFVVDPLGNTADLHSGDSVYVGRGPVAPELPGGGAPPALPAGTVSSRERGTGFRSTETPYRVPYDPAKPGGPDPTRTIDTRSIVNPGDVNASGFPRDNIGFWELYEQRFPGELSQRNRDLIGGVNPRTGRAQRPVSPTIDAQWVEAHPEQSEYFNQTLVHHHIPELPEYPTGGPQAMPVPAATHPASGGPHHGYP